MKNKNKVWLGNALALLTTALFTFAALSFTGCGNGANQTQPPTPITAVSITVTAPEAGGTPSANASASGAFAGNFSVGTVQWNTTQSTFQVSTVYTATVTLTANDGYTFEGLVAANAMINGVAANITGTPGRTVTLSFTFGITDAYIPTRITSVTITDITAPVRGATPSDTASGTGTPAGSFTVGDVTWNTTQATFQGATVYTATVILTANTGYTFTGLTAANVTINGEAASISGTPGSTVTLYKAFSITDPPTPITDVAITVIAPAIGGIPNTTATVTTATPAGSFTAGNVTWTPNHNPFLIDIVYTATITLTANDGYTFAGLTAANLTINGEEATITGTPGATVTLSFTFPATAEQAVWKMVSAGLTHGLAIKTDGSLWAWGSNSAGRTGLGIDDWSNTLVPTRVGAASKWASVSAGGWEHSLAVTTNGELWAWGNNWSGSTGLGTETGNTLVPTRVGSASNWATVSAGSEHSLAVTANGELWTWGRNTEGQLGDGTTTNRNVPIRIGTESNWATVSAGSGYSLAVTTNGQLWAWGFNLNGRTGLGIGDWSNTLVPTRVGSAYNWATVSAGSDHSHAVTTNGELWAWGWNSSGITGLGTNTGNTLAPTRVGSASNWSTVSAASSHSLAVTANGKLWAWGNNVNGQLGTDGNILVPTRVGNVGN